VVWRIFASCPSVSSAGAIALRQVARRLDKTLTDLALMFDLKLQGWINSGTWADAQRVPMHWRCRWPERQRRAPLTDARTGRIASRRTARSGCPTTPVRSRARSETGSGQASGSTRR
jgi:hypothetical protein